MLEKHLEVKVSYALSTKPIKQVHPIVKGKLCVFPWPFLQPLQLYKSFSPQPCAPLEMHQTSFL